MRKGFILQLFTISFVIFLFIWFISLQLKTVDSLNKIKHISTEYQLSYLGFGIAEYVKSLLIREPSKYFDKKVDFLNNNKLRAFLKMILPPKVVVSKLALNYPVKRKLLLTSTYGYIPLEIILKKDKIEKRMRFCFEFKDIKFESFGKNYVLVVDRPRKNEFNEGGKFIVNPLGSKIRLNNNEVFVVLDKWQLPLLEANEGLPYIPKGIKRIYELNQDLVKASSLIANQTTFLQGMQALKKLSQKAKSYDVEYYKGSALSKTILYAAPTSFIGINLPSVGGVLQPITGLPIPSSGVNLDLPSISIGNPISFTNDTVVEGAVYKAFLVNKIAGPVGVEEKAPVFYMRYVKPPLNAKVYKLGGKIFEIRPYRKNSKRGQKLIPTRGMPKQAFSSDKVKKLVTFKFDGELKLFNKSFFDSQVIWAKNIALKDVKAKNYIFIADNIAVAGDNNLTGVYCFEKLALGSNLKLTASIRFLNGIYQPKNYEAVIKGNIIADKFGKNYQLGKLNLEFKSIKTRILSISRKYSCIEED